MKQLAAVIVALLVIGSLLTIGAPIAAAQTNSFEVASIKAAPPAEPNHEGHWANAPTGSRFGPGTANPTRWNCDNCDLITLLTQAYNLKRFQVSGPDWLATARFNIAAIVPLGASPEDLSMMQQSLLAERFGLKAHIEKRDMQTYQLVVAKGTPKFNEAANAKSGAQGPLAHGAQGNWGHGAGTHEFGRNGGGGPNFVAGRTMTMTFNGNTRHIAVGESMSEFSDMLTVQLDKPVIDSTGLKGRYDFTLSFSGNNVRGGSGFSGPGDHGGAALGVGGNLGGLDAMSQPTLQEALQDQLGLRLDSKKALAVMLIIDRIQKVPSEN